MQCRVISDNTQFNWAFWLDRPGREGPATVALYLAIASGIPQRRGFVHDK